MKLKKVTYIFLIVSMLACNFVTNMVFPPPTATPVPTATLTVTASPTATLEPLKASYIPPQCQGVVPATVSPETILAQPTSEVPPNTEISQDMQLEIFENMTSLITDVYLYPDFNGKDWEGIVAKYRADVEAGLSTEEFYFAMENMVMDLGDEHSSFQPPIVVEELNSELAGENEFVGVGI